LTLLFLSTVTCQF